MAEKPRQIRLSLPLTLAIAFSASIIGLMVSINNNEKILSLLSFINIMSFIIVVNLIRSGV
ncbi:hypothetical protein PYJP_08960 [Pyrofollis japonicus]|uniref:hypothetical protein n=1 Tax=Pyrofollis japonicus TaxID=3060460 RepID=UPI00295C2906|nr:hypothetical protein [Pyrofollis japonicus]BEP17544.1 hypothetical protein PYJP_08960 [Pyrofollis japonicus]